MDVKDGLDAMRERILQLESQIQILELSVPLEEDLHSRIDEMQTHLAMQDGFTFSGIARLLNDCQKRMAADWIQISSLMSERSQLQRQLAEILNQAEQSGDRNGRRINQSNKTLVASMVG